MRGIFKYYARCLFREHFLGPFLFIFSLPFPFLYFMLCYLWIFPQIWCPPLLVLILFITQHKNASVPFSDWLESHFTCNKKIKIQAIKIKLRSAACWLVYYYSYTLYYYGCLARKDIKDITHLTKKTFPPHSLFFPNDFFSSFIHIYILLRTDLFFVLSYGGQM